MNKIIELTGSPESAYSTFLYVVQNMFSWDENGRGKAVDNMSCNMHHESTSSGVPMSD